MENATNDRSATIAGLHANLSGGLSGQPPASEPQAAAGGRGVNAPPSNTAFNNSNPPPEDRFCPLRWGVDSLYLSYKGSLFPNAEAQLAKLKAGAQAQLPEEVATAQLQLGEHIFEVKDKAFGLFAFVVEDNAFRIAFSRGTGKQLPMAYVKISSHRLASASPEAIETELRGLLEELGGLESGAAVSRIDLYVDFQSAVDMEGWDRRAWVTRAGSVNAYSVDGKFSGWAIGLGGPIAARLYDKTLELRKSRKTWLHPLWAASGWDGESRVWRLEFELKRDVLAQLGSTYLSEVLGVLGGLWRYATADWLRLAVPNDGDATRSRWPSHPLWDAVGGVDWGAPPALLSRTFSPTRRPSLDWTLRQARNAVTTFMAMYDIDALAQGFERLRDAVESDLGDLAEAIGLAPDEIIREAVALKNRRFNTALNSEPISDEDRIQAEADELAQAALAYRRQTRGG